MPIISRLVLPLGSVRRHVSPIARISTTYVQVVVIPGLLVRHRLELAAAEVATAAETAAAAIATGHDGAHKEEGLACGRSDHKVGVDILLAKLLGNVQSQRAIVVVDVPLCQITQNGMRSVYFFKLACENPKSISRLCDLHMSVFTFSSASGLSGFLSGWYLRASFL